MSLLSVENVSRSFGSLVAVDDVSMQVEAGELRAIIGPNGAGKTTFFNLISGLFPPTTGRILLDGKDITGLKPAQRVALGMARTFQITEIFPDLAVRENLRIPVEIAAGLRLFPSCRVAWRQTFVGGSTNSSRWAGCRKSPTAWWESSVMATSAQPR
jgi:branched-chain amino acid transport system ATP-binding protein